MHNLQCCHAPIALHNRIGPAYIRINKKNAANETRLKDTTMNLIRNYRNWRRYRDTVNELSRLSNRELTDLGIARSDIPFVARKSV